jgi:Ni/Co efflux regulator RcnB
MRMLVIAGATLVLTGAAQAQRNRRPGASYAAPATAMQAPMATPHRPGPIAARPPIAQIPSQQPDGQHTSRWGSKTGGRWSGGANAPGGWGGYRRPYRGWAVPSYWNAPRFHIDDWSTFGLPHPPYGYNWARYYDDAVLIDSRGSIYDTVGGVDWDRPDSGGYGYAIDTTADHGGRTPLPPRSYGAGYAQPGYGTGYAPPVYTRAPGGTWVSPDGLTTVRTSGGGYPNESTTVAVQSAPAVTTTTTTTTEYYEGARTSRKNVRRAKLR